MRNRLAFKLAMVFLITLLLPFVGFGVITYISSRISTLDTISVRALQEAGQAAARIEEYVENTRLDLITVANNISGMGLQPWQVKSILESFVLHNERFLCLTHIQNDTPGFHTSTCSSEHLASLPAKAELDRQIGSGGGYYRSGVLIEELHPVLVIGIKIPFNYQEDQYLVAHLSLLAVWDVIDKLIPKKEGGAFLLDEKGELIAHSDPRYKAEVLKKASWKDLSFTSLAAAETKSTFIGQNRSGQQSFFIRYPVSKLGWELIIEQPTKVAFADLRRFNLALVFTLLTIIILIIPVGYLAGKRLILKPVNRMMEVTGEVGKGDFTHRITLAGHDELSQLAGAFNSMQDSLIDYKREIEINERISFLARIAAGLVHDMKHPVANVKTISGLLGKKGQDDAFMQRYQKMVNDEMGKLDHILDDLHNLARPIKLNMQPMETQSFLAGIAEKGAVYGTKNNVAVYGDFAPGLKINADPYFLERVITNLVTNAVEAMPQGGRIDLSCQAQDQKAVMIIKDNGPGIPPERMERLFQDFGSTKKRGLGLGLALAKKFTVEMGGEISVESSPVKGTAFHLTFPLV